MYDARNPDHASKPVRSQEGSALVIALFMAVVAVGMSMATLTFLAANRKKSDVGFAFDSQAVQLARAGITESTNWFRRQPAQPVTAFGPRLDHASEPPVLDTDDPEVGLVREFRIAGSLWGRYEVWREWVDDPDPMRAELRGYMRSLDISASRGKIAAGSSWRLRSAGYVYRRVNEEARFDELPNHVLAVTVLESEIQRLTIVLPATAALNVGDGNRATINTYGRVIGGPDGAGIAYPQGSGTPNRGSTREQRVLGSPDLSPVPDYDDRLETVFGVSFDELAGMADFVVTRDEDFPTPIPYGSLVVADVSSLHFDHSRPLNGTAIVVVRGSVVVGQGSNSAFSGILYVDGNLTVRQPSELRGSCIVTGTCTVQGAQDYATLVYDADVIRALQASLSRYRASGPIRRLPGER